MLLIKAATPEYGPDHTVINSGFPRRLQDFQG